MQVWVDPFATTRTTEAEKAALQYFGHAVISGSISWEMPIDSQNLTALHVRYGSHAAIQQQLAAGQPVPGAVVAVGVGIAGGGGQEHEGSAEGEQI